MILGGSKLIIKWEAGNQLSLFTSFKENDDGRAGIGELNISVTYRLLHMILGGSKLIIKWEAGNQLSLFTSFKENDDGRGNTSTC